MKKIIIALVVLIGIGLFAYPMIEFKKDGKIYDFTYSDDLSRWEENLTYDETFAYIEDQDVSVTSWNIKEFLFFKMIVLDYVEGNLEETRYQQDDGYINRVINEAIIEENINNIDLAKLIEGRREIEVTQRYNCTNDYSLAIYYTLDDEYKEMYIFYVDDLLVFQIGNSDEGPTFIAYEKI